MIMMRLSLPLVVLLACCSSASSGPEPECDADSPAQYRPAIPAAELELGKRIGAGTEKVIYAGRWRGIDVAAMEILGHSKARDIALQRRIAQHPTLGAHPALVRVFGETDDGRFILNELAPLGSLTNYDGSAAVLTRPDIGGRATTAVLLEAASQILDADMALFDAGLLHRDLAARNVLAYSFSPDDPAGIVVKLTDFGLTIPIGGDPAWPPGHAMGTRWMAPEAQPTAAFEFGEASEVYAWGCLLYELFARGRVSSRRRRRRRPVYPFSYSLGHAI
jgi:serine/threonine protein kinase